METATEFVNCSIVSEESVKCNDSIYSLPEKRLTYHDKEFWMYIGIYTALVLFAGLMSGLTMGLLSLDPTTLAVMREGGTPKQRRHATRILPLVKRHHLLLVTLLLANAAAVEAMPIFLDRVSDPITAVVVSVTAVLLFGEVVPQAICTRFGLAIGAVMSPLVYFMMALLIVVAWPLSKMLDCVLGEDHGTFYRRAQLKVLVDLHGPSLEGGDNGGQGSGGAGGGGGGSVGADDEHLTVDEVLIIKGALDMKYKTARTAMVPIADVYMLSVDGMLDHETMTHIITRGHSRLPVYGGSRSNVIALLLTKTLIKLNPADCTPVAKILESPMYARPAMFVDEDMPLFDLLNQFQTGKSHLALVRKSATTTTTPQKGERKGGRGDGHGDRQPLLTIEDQPYEEEEEKESDLVGVITLEDVLEELLQEEISDESDLQTGPEMGGLLQVAMAKAASQHKHKLHRCKSQPDSKAGAGGATDGAYERQLPSSLEFPSQHLQRGSSDTGPLVTFE